MKHLDGEIKLSITYFISPYDPQIWKESPTQQKHSVDLVIDPEKYSLQMRTQWQNAEIYHPPNESTYILRWNLITVDKTSGLSGGLQKNLQIVSFGITTNNNIVNFVRWHREVIGLQYKLFLFSSVSWERIELYNGASSEEIINFINGG